MAGNVVENLRALKAKVDFITNTTEINKIRYVCSKYNHLLLRVDENDKCERINSFLLENINFNSYDAIVISDYCISEFDQEGMNFYIEHVVKKCNNAYFTINNDQASRDHLLTKLREIYNDVIIVPEEPRTSAHSNIVALCSNKI
jgi:bifunctional ADP-heptose synthase (sugar kinase/adenylyltransferase)